MKAKFFNTLAHFCNAVVRRMCFLPIVKLNKVDRKIIGRTTKCLVCLKEATYHQGYVNINNGNDDVLAGWCKEHYEENEGGSYGKWYEQYGFEEEI